MGTTYTKDDTSTSLRAGYKMVSSGRPPFIIYTHTYNRSYMKFSITDPPFTLDQIDSVVLKVRCTNIIGAGGNIRLRSDINTDNWGADLDATAGDYNSTDTEVEDTISITSTGEHEFDVDKNNLNLNGLTYFRLSYLSTSGISTLDFGSQDHGTSAYRPQLIVTYTTASGFSQAVVFG